MKYTGNGMVDVINDPDSGMCLCLFEVISQNLPVWNLADVIAFHFSICCLVLPSPVGLLSHVFCLLLFGPFSCLLSRNVFNFF